MDGEWLSGPWRAWPASTPPPYRPAALVVAVREAPAQPVWRFRGYGLRGWAYLTLGVAVGALAGLALFAR